MPKIDRTRIAGRLQNETGWICENDHRVCLGEKEACLVQGRTGRFHQRRMQRMVVNKLGLRYQRSTMTLERYPMILRTLPRRCHHRSHRLRRGAILNEPFPRPADFLLFNHFEEPIFGVSSPRETYSNAPEIASPIPYLTRFLEYVQAESV